MILSRMLMVRFAEDRLLRKRYICNSGIEQFSKFAGHFNIGAKACCGSLPQRATSPIFTQQRHSTGLSARTTRP
jgi:hypothetical protein